MSFWLYAGLLLASIAASFLLTPKRPEKKPAALTDFDFPTAEQGRPIPVVFGKVLVKDPNVVWYGDLASQPVKSEGGK